MSGRIASALVLLTLARAAGGEPVDLDRLERNEARFESLELTLAAFADALRRGDDVAPWLAPASMLALPQPESPLERQWSCVSEQRWAGVVSPLAAPAAASASLYRWRDAFGSIEDLRFELSRAAVMPDGAAVGGRFEGSVVGRDRHGRRAWLKGSGAVIAIPGLSNTWQVKTLQWPEARLLVATCALFTDVTAAAGVEARDPSFLEQGGSGLPAHGAAAGDLDLDGRVDLFATGPTGNRLYRNAGDGTFQEVAAAARASVLVQPGTAPLLVDVDADGDLDVFVAAIGRQSLLENRQVPDGRLLFRDVSARAGVDVSAIGFSAAAADVNGDHRPDVFVACYGDYGRVVPDSWHRGVNGARDLLFVSNGDGTYREAAEEMGVADPRWGYAAAFADVDADGDLDLAVANDFGGGNGLFLREGPRFREAPAARGVAVPAYAMGLSFGDPDLDGDLDLHVTQLSSHVAHRVLSSVPSSAMPEIPLLASLAAGNALLLNDGAGTFRDIATPTVALPGGWAWGGGFVDVDGDGRDDLYTPNGFVSGTTHEDTDAMFWRQVVERAAGSPTRTAGAFLSAQVKRLTAGAGFAGRERDLLEANVGGARFVDVSGVSGIDSATDGRAAVFADFDDDGDLDVFLRAMYGRAHLLFRNEIGQDAGWARVALRDEAGGPGVGAVVRMATSAGVVTRLVSAGSGFLAQHDSRLLFGLGSDAKAQWMEVTWPGGARQRLAGPRSGQSLLVVQGELLARAVSEKPSRLGGSPRSP